MRSFLLKWSTWEFSMMEYVDMSWLTFRWKLFLQHEIIAWWIFHEKIDFIIFSEDSLAPVMEQQARCNSHYMTLNVIERVKKWIIFIGERTNKIKRNFGGLKSQQPRRIMKNVVDQSRLIFEAILVGSRKWNAIKKYFFLQIQSNHNQNWRKIIEEIPHFSIQNEF